MVDNIDHSHGDVGTKPADGLNFTNGQFPDPEVFDWFWNQTVTTINNHASLLEQIDSDEDGKVDTAETADSADTVKGNDIDSDGDGKVDAADYADDADTVDGVEAADLGNSDAEIRQAIANGDAVPHPTYASKSDVPALNKGETVFIDGDGLYVEDGT